MKKGSRPAEKIGAQKAPQVLKLINNIAAPQKQKESKFEQDARLNRLPLFAGEIYSDADNFEAPEEDNITVASKKPRKKKSSSKNKIPKPIKKSSIDLSEIDDLAEADKDMKKAEGRGFTPEKMPGRKKTGRGSRFFTGMARFFGKTLGKALNHVTLDWFALGKACEKEGDNILQIINGINESNPLDQKIKQSEEYSRITMNLDNAGFQLEDLADPIFKYQEQHPGETVDPVTTKLISTEDIRNCRQALSQTIKEANILLTKYYKNDNRLHIPVMHLISDLTYATQNLDQIYAERQKGAKTEGELGDLRADMRSTEFKFYYGEDQDKEVSFTPTHYEYYLQIYKTPQAALENYAKLKELVDMENNHQKLSSAQKKELAKLRRMEDLANQFDTAHEYMLEKDAFNQQDINYAFEASALQRSAGAAGISGDMIDFHQNSGDVYQSLFLQKIFGGMEQRFLHAKDEDSYKTDGKNDPEKFQKWLDKDMTECVNKKAKGMMMILRGMKRALPESEQNKDHIMEGARNMIFFNWVKKIFKGESEKENFASAYATDNFYLLMDDNKSSIRRTIEGLIKTLLAEDKIIAPDPKMAQRRDKSNNSAKAVGNKKIKKNNPLFRVKHSGTLPAAVKSALVTGYCIASPRLKHKREARLIPIVPEPPAILYFAERSH